MRYTPTLKLSTRLVAFVTMTVISAMFILFLGGTLSFQRLGQEYLNHYLQGIVDVVDKEMEDPDAAYSMQRWMPKMLQAGGIIEMQLSSEAGTVYRFKDTANTIESARLYQVALPLKRNPDYVMHFKAIPPYLSYNYSLQAMWSTTLAVLLIIFFLLRGLKWLKEQLLGSELLEERGRMILAGRVEQHAKGDPREWPYTASEALDRLIEELQDARQERSRFDTFIRSQTFLDQLTGTANRVLYDSKLESALLESGAHGGVMMLRLDDLESTREESPKRLVDEFIIEVGECLSNIVQRYPDAILSRYYDDVFALFIPHQGSKDVALVATQAIKLLERIVPPEPLSEEKLVPYSVSPVYQEGERRGRIIDEMETALKSAQLQGVNAWSRFQKPKQLQEDRGSVRWRTLFEQALRPDAILLYRQACYLLSANGEREFVHYELFARIQDPQQGILKASRFSSALETVGYEAMLDRAVFGSVVSFLKQAERIEPVSVNLHVVPFSDKRYARFIRNELMQMPFYLRSALSFEFAEAHLIKHLDYMRPIIRMLAGLGCKVVVGQAGRTIVSTHYIKDLKINYLKLHRSLIKKIDQRHENQLFVRSLVGVCGGTQTEVIAVGVETEQEWQTLQMLGVKGVQGRLFDDEQQMLPPQPREQTKLSQRMSLIPVGKRNRWRTK
ncbi:RNase E specificity factor CsrD [Vibrio metoecus]|uniref:RNase E specificity factor CsrD n=1 Tax=Vibrio metoecus TaxID=1481663 RepID=UPI0006D804F9|nr:RNase E specificity factor CsrD [Vibrio metoecus]KQA21530.1 diguanylate phosphodiesterase [Vibrio metoecus]